jgi:Resolvase, N terminal domain
VPANQCFMALSLAPVQLITVLIARCVKPSSPFRAAAIAFSNSPSLPGPRGPREPRCNSLPLFRQHHPRSPHLFCIRCVDGRHCDAASRGIEIIKTYADEGKSGLRIDGRNALKSLIDDVQSGSADFQTILVYDVSRWGRFQDADESAYYEYICKRAGITVQYCAEQFENDGSPVSTIVKGVKRAMAGEYSRELSAKVFAGQCRLIELGLRQGGPPGSVIFCETSNPTK